MTPPSQPVEVQQVDRGAFIPEERTESSPLLSGHQSVPNQASDEESGATKSSPDDEQGDSSVIGLLSVLLIGMIPLVNYVLNFSHNYIRCFRLTSGHNPRARDVWPDSIRVQRLSRC